MRHQQQHRANQWSTRHNNTIIIIERPANTGICRLQNRGCFMCGHIGHFARESHYGTVTIVRNGTPERSKQFIIISHIVCSSRGVVANAQDSERAG